MHSASFSSRSVTGPFTAETLPAQAHAARHATIVYTRITVTVSISTQSISTQPHLIMQSRLYVVASLRCRGCVCCCGGPYSKQHCVPSSIVLLSEYNARWILGKSRTLRNRAGRTLECTAIGRWLRFDRHTGRNRTANGYRRPRRRGPGISGCKRMWISVIFLPSQAGKDLYVLVAVA